MTERRPAGRSRPSPTLDEIDIEKDAPHPARMYDFVLGGQTNFAADRTLAGQMGEVLPGGLEFGRLLARRNRAFMARAVRHLTAEAGVRQFLDLGAGIPAYDNTHEIAQEIAPASRIVYVDYDPIVLAHAHERLQSSPEGAVEYIHADVRDPDGIMGRAATTLDLEQPVALLMIALLHLVADGDDPYGLTSRLVDALPAGSFLAVSHFTADRFQEAMTGMASVYNQSGQTMAIRSRDEVAGFFDGLDLVDPGVVLIEDWRPDPDDPEAPADPEADPVPLYGGVATKR